MQAFPGKRFMRKRTSPLLCLNSLGRCAFYTLPAAYFWTVLWRMIETSGNELPRDFSPLSEGPPYPYKPCLQSAYLPLPAV